MATIADLEPIEDLIARFEPGGSDAGPGGGTPRVRSDRQSTGSSAAGGGGTSRGGTRRRQEAGQPERSLAATDRTDPSPDGQKARPAPDPIAAGAPAPEKARDGGSRTAGVASPLGASDAGAAKGAGSVNRSSSDAYDEEALASEGSFDATEDPGGSWEESAADDEAADDAIVENGIGANGGDGGTGGVRAEAGSGGAPAGMPHGLLEALHERRMPLAVLVEQAAWARLEDERLVLFFSDSSAFARKSLEQPANLDIVRQTATEVLGKAVSVEVRRAVPPASHGAPPLSRDSGRPLPAIPKEGARAEGPEPDATPEEEPQSDLGAARGDAFEAHGPAAGARGGGAGARGQDAGGRGDAAGAVAAVAGAGGVAAGSSAAPAGAGGGRSAPQASPIGEAKRRRLMAEAAEDPVVSDLIRRFEARIVEVKEAQ